MHSTFQAKRRVAQALAVGAIIGGIIGQAFDGTALPLVLGFFVLAVIGLIFVLIAERGKLFQAHGRSA